MLSLQTCKILASGSLACLIRHQILPEFFSSSSMYLLPDILALRLFYRLYSFSLKFLSSPLVFILLISPPHIFCSISHYFWTIITFLTSITVYLSSLYLWSFSPFIIPGAHLPLLLYSFAPVTIHSYFTASFESGQSQPLQPLSLSSLILSRLFLFTPSRTQLTDSQLHRLTSCSIFILPRLRPRFASVYAVMSTALRQDTWPTSEHLHMTHLSS